MKHFSWLALWLSFLPVAVWGAGEPERTAQAQRLAALARATGYVRFFYPTRAAAEADWNQALIAGAAAVRDATDAATLRVALLETLAPLAPELRLRLANEPATTFAALPPNGFWTWQHAGVDLANAKGGAVFGQRLVQAGTKQGDFAPFFAWDEQPPAPVRVEIYPGLWLEMPLALADAPDRPSPGAPVPPRTPTSAPTGVDDWRVRFADVATVWTVFQHFHPYLAPGAEEWRDALEPAIADALTAGTPEEHYSVMKRLVARTHDGHGVVYAKSAAGGIPIRVVKAEGQLVIAQVAEGAPFVKGDVIRRLDGEDALAVLTRRSAESPGSPQLSEFRALNQFGAGPIGSVARVEITRAGSPQTVEFTRVKERRGYFFNALGEFALPAFAEVRPGIFYVNLYACDAPTLEQHWPQLAAARGLIFDWRFELSTGFAPPIDEATKSIQPHAHIIPHLIDTEVYASPMRVPMIMRPDRAGWTFREATWPVRPAAPRVRGKVVFIMQPSVVSYGETCAAILADYKLAAFVGAPTAGCNGNANFITLPSGPRVMWTGMEVLKHDRTPFYGIGFGPDYPVERTVAGVRDGRDELLEKAITVIEQAAPEVTPGAAKQP